MEDLNLTECQFCRKGQIILYYIYIIIIRPPGGHLEESTVWRLEKTVDSS